MGDRKETSFKISWTRIGLALFGIIWLVINIVLMVYEFTADWYRITLASDALSLSRPFQICLPLQFPCVEYGANDRWTHCTIDAKSQATYCGYDTTDCTYNYKPVCGIYSYGQALSGSSPSWMRNQWRALLAACLLVVIFQLSLIPSIVCCLHQTRFAKFYLPVLFCLLFVAVIIQAYCVFGYAAREVELIGLLTPLDQTRLQRSWLHTGWNCALALFIIWFVIMVTVAVYSTIIVRKQMKDEQRRQERRENNRIQPSPNPPPPRMIRYL